MRLNPKFTPLLVFLLFPIFGFINIGKVQANEQEYLEANTLGSFDGIHVRDATKYVSQTCMEGYPTTTNTLPGLKVECVVTDKSVTFNVTPSTETYPGYCWKPEITEYSHQGPNGYLNWGPGHVKGENTFFIPIAGTYTINFDPDTPIDTVGKINVLLIHIKCL